MSLFTATFESGPDDGYVSMSDPTYMNAASGNGTPGVSHTSVTASLGQLAGIDVGVEYDVYQVFLTFDLSPVAPSATIEDPVLTLHVETDASTVDFDVMVGLYDWAPPLTPADFVGDPAAPVIPLGAASTATISASTLAIPLDATLLTTAVRKNPVVRLALASSRQQSVTAPSVGVGESITITTGDSPSNRPTLEAGWDVGRFTRRLYDRLPQFYRTDDLGEPSGGGQPLLRYIALIGDQADRIEVLWRRFHYRPPDDPQPTDPADAYGTGLYGTAVYAGDPTSDLVDPVTADDSWLWWLSQLVGANQDDTADVDIVRAGITHASRGWQAGSRQSFIDTARAHTRNGEGTVTVDPFTTGSSAAGAATMWDIRVTATEIEDEAAALAALEAVTPAGATVYLVSA